MPTTAVSEVVMRASLNGSPFLDAALSQERHVDTVQSASAFKPDPSWHVVDANGHYHAWAANGTLPTLRVQYLEDTTHSYEDEGEAPSRPHYYCHICSEEIDPVYVPDTEPVNVEREVVDVLKIRTPLENVVDILGGERKGKKIKFNTAAARNRLLSVRFEAWRPQAEDDPGFIQMFGVMAVASVDFEYGEATYVALELRGRLNQQLS